MSLVLAAICALACNAAAVVGDGARREHKVHNIVLYPERHSWCQTTPIKQIVAMPGFEPVTIDNNVCVGACYSYSIPRTQPAEPGELIGPYCDSCQPKETKCYHVTLKASGGGKSMQKRVQIIANCSCASCGRQLDDANDCDLHDPNTPELPAALLSLTHASGDQRSDAHEVPELLAVGSAPIANHTPHAHHQHHHHQHHHPRTYVITDKVRHLLERIGTQSSAEETDDDDVLLDLTPVYELVAGADERLSDADVMEFVNYVNEHLEDVDVDALRLKGALERFAERRRREELRTRHRNFGMGPAITSSEAPPVTNHHHHHHHQHQQQHHPEVQQPIVTGIEGSHLGLGHRKGAHIGMGIREQHLDENTIPVVDDNDDDRNEEEVEENVSTPSTHRHHVGEETHIVGGVGHLVMGPHGSLVVAPAAAVDLETHEVAPNQEGVVIDYQHGGGDDGGGGGGGGGSTAHVHHHHNHNHHHTAAENLATALNDDAAFSL